MTLTTSPTTTHPPSNDPSPQRGRKRRRSSAVSPPPRQPVHPRISGAEFVTDPPYFSYPHLITTLAILASHPHTHTETHKHKHNRNLACRHSSSDEISKDTLQRDNHRLFSLIRPPDPFSSLQDPKKPIALPLSKQWPASRSRYSTSETEDEKQESRAQTCDG
ncbi:hypothetical protein EYC84_005479 [Monilinia fructicola]|uniref:Uncharacterized protein n=1 Tax=Monilinia fructicola TaxID=38448 RepID=A0A5M9JZ46_MONFR|nr:hypothetical protein EYC84_005479 [Monilinia fructicola]